jgi:nitrogen fixation/metabolism regulation signal transduction histidine kinase
MEDETHFAPALRSNKEQIFKEYELVGSQRYFTEIFGALTGIGAVLDENRQIVFANSDFLSLLGIDTLESILGKRPGEVISCVHATEEPLGCGTSFACAYCGAVTAILESQRSGKKAIKETRITRDVDGKTQSWDMNIISTPVKLSGNMFYVLVLQDISDEKRRSALERIFFHDLLNTAGGLNGLLSILKEGADPEEARELINLSEEVSRDILDEIMLHRQIRAAEMGDLQIKIEKVNSLGLLSSAVGKISSHEVGKNKTVVISDKVVDIDFETDKNLFQRVIINLLKNALEATESQNSVSAGVESEDDIIRFWVKNDSVIPIDVQMQLFQRSFSTKGTGRGIGTYSIRLLTENYLKGKVSFVSNETDGTVFSIELKKKFPADHADLY